MKGLESLFVLLTFLLILPAQSQNYYCELYNLDNGLRSINIQSIYIENDASIWLGTDAGLTHIKKNSSRHYHSSNANLISDNVQEIIKAYDKIWIRTNSGISRLDGNSFINTFILPPIGDYCIPTGTIYKRQKAFPLN